MNRVTGAFLACAIVAPSASALTATGNVYGTTTDASGGGLRGASVALEGPTGTRRTTSGEDGEFRFLQLGNGRYTVRVALGGFTAVESLLEDLAVDSGTLLRAQLDAHLWVDALETNQS